MTSDEKTDNGLRNLFQNFRPTLSNSDEFARRLQARLHAAVIVKEYQRRQRRAYWAALTSAFVVGLICGLVANEIADLIPRAGKNLMVDFMGAGITLTPMAVDYLLLVMAGAAITILSAVIVFRLVGSRGDTLAGDLAAIK